MNDQTTFQYERYSSNDHIKQAIDQCEGHHVQQVAYSSYMGALTQICFTCQKIRGVIFWDKNRSWGGERGKPRPDPLSEALNIGNGTYKS